MKIPTLRFVIDHEYDARMLHNMLQSSGKNLENQSYNFGIDFMKAKQISRGAWGDVHRSAKHIIEQRYRALGSILSETRDLYQKSWNQINRQFFVSVKKITGYVWEYPSYTCVVSAFHRGVSNWNGNTIARIWNENPYSMRKFTAHELIISHVFSIFRRDHDLTNSLSDQQTWALSEIIAWSMTGFEKELLKLWPWVEGAQRFPLKHNYPELVPLQKHLASLYQKRNSFEGFLKKGIQIVRKTAS